MYVYIAEFSGNSKFQRSIASFVLNSMSGSVIVNNILLKKKKKRERGRKYGIAINPWESLLRPCYSCESGKCQGS